MLVAVVLLGALRAVLPFVLESLVNNRLANIEGYEGRVEDIDVALWRGAYQLEGLTLVKTNGEVSQPLLDAGLIDFSLSWRQLLRGRILSDIQVRDTRLTLVQGTSAARTQTPAPTESRWQDVVEDLFPIEITHLEFERSQLRLYNEAEGDLPYDIRLRNVHATATGLRNRAASAEEELPAQIDISADTDGGGTLQLSGRAAPLADQPRFNLDLRVRSVDLPQLNDFLRAYVGADVRAGTFSLFAEMTAADGGFEGYLKPFLEDMDFTDVPAQDKPLLGELWEGVVQFAAFLFKNHSRDQLGTRVPFSGEFGEVDVATLTAVGNVLRHAFIQAFQERIDDTIGNDAEDAAETEEVAEESPSNPDDEDRRDDPIRPQRHRPFG